MIVWTNTLVCPKQAVCPKRNITYENISVAVLNLILKSTGVQISTSISVGAWLLSMKDSRESNLGYLEDRYCSCSQSGPQASTCSLFAQYKNRLCQWYATGICCDVPIRMPNPL